MLPSSSSTHDTDETMISRFTGVFVVVVLAGCTIESNSDSHAQRETW